MTVFGRRPPKPDNLINCRTPSRIVGADVMSTNALIFILSINETQKGYSCEQISIELLSVRPVLTCPKMNRPPFFMSFTKSMRLIDERGLETSNSICGRQNLTCSLRGSSMRRYFRT